MAAPWEEYQKVSGPWDEYKATTEVAKTPIEVQPPSEFGETGGGAATGRPMRNVQLNVQEKPRPLESVFAGITKAGFVDTPIALARLLSGGKFGKEAAEKYAQEFKPYQEASPVGFGAGQIAGSLIPGSAVMKGTSMIPSFAASPLAQNVATGTALGLLSPEEKGKTGAEFYKEQAKEGAIGAALGTIPTLAGKAMGFARGPEQSDVIKKGVEKAREVGYVIPPTQANESIVNRAIEGISGKIATAQNASAKNQAVTNKLTAKSLGLPEDTVITPDVLQGLRTKAGKAYSKIASVGEIVPSDKYFESLDKIAEPFIKTQKAFPNSKPSPVLDVVNSLKTDSFDAAAAVEKIKQLRTAADDADNTDIARASKSAAKTLEDAIEDHLVNLGDKTLLNDFKDARQLIAKTYTVEKAANKVTGTIDAKKLAAELKKGKPLSEELKTVAEFSTQFPKATQTTEAMGSLPQISPLDFATAIIGSSSGNPAAGGAVLARPGLRALALSNPVQNRLIQGKPMNQSELARLLMMQSGKQLIGE
jgi:hypothetical protein